MSIQMGSTGTAFLRCYVYADGQYVRKELRDAGQNDEFDPSVPAKFISNEFIGNRRVIPVRIFYYDAVDEAAEESEQTRQKSYLKRVQQLEDIRVVMGRVRQGRSRREQKGVDVQLAVDALKAAWSRVVDAIVLVTGDADFAPLADAIRELGPHVIVLAFARSLAEDFANAVDRALLLPPPPADWIRPLGDPEATTPNKE